MNKSTIKVYAVFLVLFGFALSSLQAQRIDDVTSILSKFKNYRFGAVNVYKITTPDELKEIIESKRKKATSAGAADAKCLEEVDPAIKDIVEKGILSGSSQTEIARNIITSGYTPPEATILDCVYKNLYDQLVGGGEATTPKAYLVTSRPEKGQLPDRIIGMIYMELDFDQAQREVREDLEFVSTDNIYSYDRLKDTKIDPAKYGYENMYDLTYAYLVQGNFENETMAARAIGTDVIYLDKVYGVSQPLINNNRINARDIQMYKRISAGQPEKYTGKSNILTASPDLISWTQYDIQYQRKRNGEFVTDSLGNKVINPRRASNDYLPNFGVELKYGIEGINYPSFWSNRATLSAIWKNVKFGVILPTDGWASFSEDVFNQQRTMTYGGVGVAGVLDFPFAIIPRSDVFRVNFGYVFGDAEPGIGTSSINTDPFEFNPDNSFRANDYLMRFNMQAHYTFGISVDEDYFMRFSLGGTGYSMERWGYEIDLDDLDPEATFEERGSEFVGGLSGKLEFMTTNNTTPFGGGIQYFDESLQFNGWVQVPVVENTFSIRLEANGYAVAFRKDPRPWEMNSLLVPMARLIYVF